MAVEESMALKLSELKERSERAKEAELRARLSHEESVKDAQDALNTLTFKYGVHSVEEALKLLKDKKDAFECLVAKANKALDNA